MLGVGATKARELWLDVIEGRRHPLTHGYFCTRQPDDDERSSGISSTDARTRELEYFRDNAPWSSSTHRDRFGMNNLVVSLSNLLVQVIRNTYGHSVCSSHSILTYIRSLPHLRTETAQCLETCKRELVGLPEPIKGDLVSYTIKLVTSFSDDIRGYVEGRRNSEKLIRENKKAYSDFLASIKGTAPDFRAFLNADEDPSTRRERGPDVQSSDASDPTRHPIYLSEMRDRIQEWAKHLCAIIHS